MIEKLKEPWLKRGETLLCFGDSLTANENFSRREIFGIRATIEIEEDE